MKIVFILILIGHGSSNVGSRLAVYEKYDQCQKTASIVQSKSLLIDVFCIPANG